jgi:hypothetical protein
LRKPLIQALLLGLRLGLRVGITRGSVERMGFLTGASLKLPAFEAGCYGGRDAITMQSSNRSAKVFR